MYVNTLDPDVSLISCGSNSYGHPDQDTLNRLLATSMVYLTEQGEPSRDYGSAVIVNDDIVIRSTNGVNYTVNGNAYIASDPPPQRTLKQQILDQIAVLERELEALRALAQQLPD